MRLFNTQTGTIERFNPRPEGVGIYVCGVTPYDTTHAGHAFTFLTFDILVRCLRAFGNEVTYVQNVTDIDDDIIKKAKERGTTWSELGLSETAKYRQDMANLNVLEFDHYTKATEHVSEMLDIIEKLVAKGHAYVSNGSVYFSVKTDPEFGKLSRIPKDQMLAVANERGNFPDDPNKQDPIDFILWQAAAPDEPTWESPYGPGRPGWHIECSAMATKYLGNHIDIHGGGADLVFPHHECEIAQTENATGVKPFVGTWMHVAMVGYQGEKMSKSLGNLVLVREVLENYSADAFRLYLFSHHYRKTWEYVDDEIYEWAQLAQDFIEAVEFPAYGIEQVVDVSVFQERFYNAIDEDLDTPSAIEALREMSQAILQAPEEEDVRDAQDTLRSCAELLGLTLSA